MLRKNFRVDKFNEIISNWEVPRAQSKEQAWEELQQKVNLQESADEKKVIPIWKKLAVPVAAAASIALLLWFVLMPNAEMVNHVTLAGDHSEIELPDGSKVILNASSTLEYDKASWNENRELTITGEAFFEVQNGSKFTVKTESGNVSVLGTSFNVFNRNDILEVACFTGKVQVDCSAGSKTIEPGQCAVSDAVKMHLTDFNPAQKDWRTGHYSYDGAPLGRVLNEVALQYNLDIKYDDKVDRQFYGSFRVSDDNSKEILSIICKAMSLDYDFVNAQTVVITEK
ncbi:FecR family protein [Halocola ammonii]